MALSQNIKNKMDHMRPQFPTAQALLIPLLHEIQFEKGWLSIDDQRAAAEYLELPLSKVKEVVSFYTMFNMQPVGKVHLQLCTNISCWLNGSEKILHCLEKRLKVTCGQTTSNQNYTLSEVECLASCGTAPVLQVNETYYEALNEQSLNKLLDEIDVKLSRNDLHIGKVSLEGDQL